MVADIFSPRQLESKINLFMQQPSTESVCYQQTTTRTLKTEKMEKNLIQIWKLSPT